MSPQHNGHIDHGADADKFKAVPAMRPANNIFVTPGTQLDAIVFLLLADIEVDIARGAVPAEIVAAKFIRARAIAQSMHASASVQQYIGYLAESIDFGLRPYGETINSKEIATYGAR